MKRMRHGILAMMCLTALLAGCRPASGRPVSGKPDAPVAEEKTVFPDFKVRTLDGGEASLAQYRGKILILDLFATWCPPCRKEIPHFVELQNQYRDRLKVVGLSYDQGPTAVVKKFMQDMGINYDVYLGTEEIAAQVGLRGIPHTLVLDADGRVYRSYVGYHSKAVFEQDVLDLSQKTPEPEARP